MVWEDSRSFAGHLMEISEKVWFSPLRIFFLGATRSAALKNHRFFGRFAPRSRLPEKIYSGSKPPL